MVVQTRVKNKFKSKFRSKTYRMNEDEIFLHEMINTMIYIYLAISSGMEKNPTYIYIYFPSGKTLELGREWSFQHRHISRRDCNSTDEDSLGAR